MTNDYRLAYLGLTPRRRMPCHPSSSTATPRIPRFTRNDRSRRTARLCHPPSWWLSRHRNSTVHRTHIPSLGSRAALIAGVASLIACNGRSRPAVEPPAAALARTAIALDSTVSVVRIAPGLWMHTSLDPASGFPSNGMLLERDGGSVLFDTAWDDRETTLLLAWAANDLHKPVRSAVITHAHVDRLGGLGALRRAGIPATALAATVNRAAADGLVAAAGRATPGGGVASDPAPALDSIPGLERAPRRNSDGFELYYPGVGHTADNIVVYFAGSRVLFGGCLIKSDTATTVGNVADADVAQWPLTVARVAARYPDAATIIPGHGGVSAFSALAVTRTLITDKGPAAAEALRRRQNKPQ
jgi:metallo-beta-lactamase class B